MATGNGGMRGIESELGACFPIAGDQGGGGGSIVDTYLYSPNFWGECTIKFLQNIMSCRSVKLMLKLELQLIHLELKLECFKS